MSTTDTVSLFNFSNTGGCSAKFEPLTLKRFIASLSPISNPNLLADFTNSEDAAVYKLTEDIAIVATVDMIAPAVDDPTIFGQITAANALSDVYAMGGAPTLCLGILEVPEDVDYSIVEQILSGASSKIIEAGAQLVGGHTIRSKELLFGVAVFGIAEPDKI